MKGYTGLLDAGFEQGTFSIEPFNEDLVETTAGQITGFLRAFTAPGFSAFFRAEDL